MSSKESSVYDLITRALERIWEQERNQNCIQSVSLAHCLNDILERYKNRSDSNDVFLYFLNRYYLIRQNELGIVDGSGRLADGRCGWCVGAGRDKAWDCSGGCVM